MPRRRRPGTSLGLEANARGFSTDVRPPDRSQRHVPPPLPGPHGDHRHGPPGHAVLRRARGQRPAGPQDEQELHPALDGRRPEPHGHLGPEAREREERRPVQADRDLGPRRDDQRAPADRRQADEAPEHHPLARLEGRQPRPRHLHDAHRATPRTRPSCIPSFGSVCSYELGEQARELRPAALHLDQQPGRGRRASSGMAHSPFVVQNPNAPIANLQPPSGRRRRCGWTAGCRCSAWSRTTSSTQKRGQAADRPQGRLREDDPDDELALHQGVQARRRARGGPRRLRPQLVRLGLPDGPAAGRGGRHVRRGLPRRLGHARRHLRHPLRTASCPSSTRGWAPWSPTSPSAACSTTRMVVWMGDFGRTPRINQNGGRDHWPRSWSIVMGGGGMKGGQAIGDDRQGRRRHRRPPGRRHGRRSPP